MTPLEIEILLWYHCRAADYRDGDFSAPAVRDTIDNFRDHLGLIENRENGRCGDYPCTYRLTDRGEAYVGALKAVPLPVKTWVMPTSSS